MKDDKVVSIEENSAFALYIPDGHYNGSVVQHGMSLRDWYAGLAMQGALSNGQIDFTTLVGVRLEAFTNGCFLMADSMIKSRDA